MRFVIFTWLVLVVLIGTGCATRPEAVQVPIAVPCKVEEPQQPTYRFTPPYDDVFSVTRDLLGDREVSLGYEEELRAALRACK